MTEMELTQFFSKFGEVKDAKIITDRDGGKSRGYAICLQASTMWGRDCRQYKHFDAILNM